ncbi:hypothetical protein VMCG_06384 [Cytospora schulzeri]|uniref:Uncharacterized protein n=1 Tax=Cytospora schulzeri TaxID=448051 RepID=A0A423W846_9PEZI|nr:hypothetical protein VMCG_06384 [Valsa malicola]
MPFKLPYLSLYLRQVVTGKAPSGKPWTKAVRNKLTIQDVVRNRLTPTQGHSLWRLEAQRPIVYPARRHWLHPAPAQPPPLARKEISEEQVPEGVEMSEAEIFEREIDPTDKDSWSRGPDMPWLRDVPDPDGRREALWKHPKGPYIQTKEGLVHIATYYP